MTRGIAELRECIDAIDRQIVELLADRLRLVMQVGEVKRAERRVVYDPARERDLLDRVAKAAAPPLTAEMAERVFQCIIKESRDLEQRHVAALIGEHGSEDERSS